MAFTGIGKVCKAALGYDIGDVVIAGCSFTCNGSSAISSSGYRGDILSSATRDSQGVYTVTLRDMGYEIISVQATPEAASAAKAYLEIGAPNTTALTVVVRSFVNNSATDIVANDRIHLLFVLRKTGVARRR